MSELLTMQDLANGHLDVKALGEAANGDENTIVTTRTGNTYPSAERAINIMFQNGGLPATPFATKAEMQTDGASLADGQLAMVYNETANNGLYVKEAGSWVKSAYDPLMSAKSYTDEHLSDLQSNIDMSYTHNMFDGVYKRGGLSKVTDSSYQWIKPDDPSDTYYNGTICINKVEPGKTYTLKVFDAEATDSMRIGEYKAYPESYHVRYAGSSEEKGGVLYFDNTREGVTNTGRVKEVTFTVSSEANYIAVCFSRFRSVRPKVTLTEGSEAPKAYIPHAVIENIRQLKSSDVIPAINKSANIFDGIYHSISLYPFGESQSLHATINYIDYKFTSVIIEVEPSTTYTFSSPDAHLVGRFRIGFFSDYPEVGTRTNRGMPANFKLEPSVSEASAYTFKTLTSTKYVVIYISSTGRKPRVMINKGSMALDYEAPDRIKVNHIEGGSLATKASANLFNDNYINARLSLSGNNATLDKEDADSDNLTGIVHLNPESVYTISTPDVRAAGPITLALFSTDPSENEEAVGDVILSQDEFTKHTFYTPSGSDFFLAAWVSTDGFRRRIQVEQKGYASEHKENKVIPFELLESEDDTFRPLQKYGMLANFNRLYRLKDFEYVRFTKSEDVINFYDSLLPSLNGYVTKKKLGTDKFGYSIYAYRTSPRVQWLSQTQIPSETRPGNRFIKNPKIIISAGVHGSEWKSLHGVMMAFKQIMLNPDNDPELEFIKRHVDITFIPIVNNSGFEDVTYHNRDDLNPNRDFPPTGKLVTTEATILKSYLDEHSDADFYLDCHTGSNHQNRFGYFFTDVPYLVESQSRVYQQLGAEWQKILPGMPQNLDYSFVWAVDTTRGMTIDYPQVMYGTRNMIIETPATNPYMTLEQEIQFYTELFINTLFNVLKMMQK